MIRKQKFVKFFIHLSIALALNICTFIEANAVAKKVVLFDILCDKKILAMQYWEVNDAIYLAVVKEDFDGENVFNGARSAFFIYKKKDGAFTKIFEHYEDDGFSVFSFLNGHLVTEWIGGSAFHYRIYNIGKSKIELVLEEGSHNPFETEDFDNDGNVELLISEGAYLRNINTHEVIQYPTETRIFKWNGIKYELIKIVPWKERFAQIRK